MMAICKKEFKSNFLSPLGYVLCGVMFLVFGIYYFQVLMAQSSDYIPQIYTTLFTWILLIVLPIVTMRSFSEEIRNKSDQGLLTAPVSVTAIVMGKFLASFFTFGLALTATLVPAAIVSFFSSPDWATIFSAYFGSLLCGIAMIAIGNFISSLTQSQVVAAIASFGTALMLMMIGQFSSSTSNAFLSNLFTWISFDSRYQPFTKGILNLSSIVFFLSVAVVFLFLTARKLESKRWS